MKQEEIILEKITNFIKDGKMFTSVDISNAIKMEGIWVRNRTVRDFLQDLFLDKDLFTDYTISQIFVCNNSSLASLYHHNLSDPNDYLDRDQHCLTPDEVKSIQKELEEAAKNDPDINKILDEDSEEDTNIKAKKVKSKKVKVSKSNKGIIIRSINRIKIPGSLIRELGWETGQRVDTSVIKTHKPLPSHLRVNDDYRVSIPRTSVKWGTSPVKVILKQGEIHFKKA